MMGQQLFELIHIIGGIDPDEEIITSTSSCVSKISIAVFATKSRLILRRQKGESSESCVIPWTSEQGKEPVALALSPTAEHLIVAVCDSTLYVLSLWNIWEEPLTSRNDPATDANANAGEASRENGGEGCAPPHNGGEGCAPPHNGGGSEGCEDGYAKFKLSFPAQGQRHDRYNN